MSVAVGRAHQRGSTDLLSLVQMVVASWRYAATPVGRDARLDLLRGYCVLAMVIDHIGGPSWLYTFTGGNVGPISAAEGFVFLSGLVLGIVSRARIARGGLRLAVRSALHRAWTLYALTVGLTLLFSVLTLTTTLSLWVDRALWTPRDWPSLLVATALLRFTWNGTDILVLYTVMLGVTPLILYWLAEGHARRVLAGSLGLWAVHLVAPEQVVLPWPIENAHIFPVSSWQALFVGALVLGYHRAEVEAWLARQAASPEHRALRRGLVATAGGLLVAAWAWSTDHAFAFVPGEHPLASVALFDKASLGPGRVLVFLTFALLVFGVTTYAWRPIERALGWLLIPLGQTSLYGYTMHLLLILVAYNVPPYVGVDAPGLEFHNTVGQLVLQRRVLRPATMGVAA